MFRQPQALEMEERYATARSAAGLAILSVLSPIVGIAVETAVAWRFGTSAAVDAFRIALAIVYIGQQLFVGSLFPNVIIPLFAESRVKGNEAEAWRSAIVLSKLALVPTSIVSLMLFSFPSAAVWVLAPGLGPQARQWAIFFVRWFGLSLIPFLFSGAAIGLLQARRVFWSASAAQLAYNLVLVASILLFGRGVLGATSIALGVLLATAMFMLLQLVPLTAVIRADHARQCWTHEGIGRASIRKSIRAAVPLLALPLINQATAIVACWSLSAASVGTIAALGYAGKLMRMASLLPDVLATVLFPRFAGLARDPKELRQLATRAMRMALFISLPIACTLFVLRAPVVAVFLHHGAFSDTAVRTVSLLFGFFLIGMPAGIMSFYLAKVFYALEETWWPTSATILSLIFAAVAMPLAANHFGAQGVAATYAGISWLGALVQTHVLHSKYAGCKNHTLMVFAVRTLAPSAAAAWLGGIAAQTVHASSAGGVLGPALEFASGVMVAFVSYWLVVLIARVPEALEVKQYMQWQSAPLLAVVRTAIRASDRW